MHKSRLVSFVIDCNTSDTAGAAEFWSKALGRAPKPDAEDPNYVNLEDRAGQPIMMVQKVDHPSRVHLDIETDDIEAEVKRLEALGAKRVAQVKRWWVMEAPSGQRFCVVRPQRKDFPAGATEWA